MNYALTKISSNSKTGAIPVTVSNRKTCPPSCPLLKNGCYAEGYYTQLHWDKVTSGERGTGWDQFISDIKALPKRILWRHNVSGDLVGNNDKINNQALKELVQANKNKLGFTYTHYPMSDNDNLQAVLNANKQGFAVNASANTIDQADTYIKQGLPTVVILPSDAKKVSFTPNNNKIVVCPAQNSDKVTCSSCGLCQKSDRDYIIGFKVHGAYTKKATMALSL